MPWSSGFRSFIWRKCFHRWRWILSVLFAVWYPSPTIWENMSLQGDFSEAYEKPNLSGHTRTEHRAELGSTTSQHHSWAKWELRRWPMFNDYFRPNLFIQASNMPWWQWWVYAAALKVDRCWTQGVETGHWCKQNNVSWMYGSQKESFQKGHWQRCEDPGVQGG